jgi:PAS domain S-box-containing protein
MVAGRGEGWEALSGGEGWEALFWLLFERTSNPVVLVDLDRQILAANGPAATLLGAARASPGRPAADIIAPDERDRSAAEWEDLLRSHEYTGTRTLLRGDGSKVPVEFAARLAEIENRRVAVYVVADPPERRGPVSAARELPLTNREREVVTLIALGRTTGQIARELYLSPATVRTHVRNAMGKLKVHTRAELVATAMSRDQALHAERLRQASD